MLLLFRSCIVAWFGISIPFISPVGDSLSVSDTAGLIFEISIGNELALIKKEWKAREDVPYPNNNSVDVRQSYLYVCRKILKF